MPSRGSGALNSPSTSSFVPSQSHSRRPSHSSAISSKPVLNKQALSQALDHIHVEASQSDALTTFDDYASPRPGSKGESKNFATDVVQGGLSGLYSRIKASVGGTVSTSSGQNSPADALSINSNAARYKGTGSGAVHSPTTPSIPSRVQSPLAPHFPSSSKGHVSIAATPSATSLQSKTSSARPTSAATNGSGSLGGKHGGTLGTSDEVATRSTSSLGAPVGNAGRPSNEADGSRLSHNSESVLPFAQTLPLQRQNSDMGSILTDTSSVHDPDQTPRVNKSTRPTLQLEGNSFMSRSSQSITSKGDEEAIVDEPERGRSNEAQSIGESAPLERPPMVHIGQSHLPGFRASRTNSSDGDVSSLATTIAQIRRPNFDALDEHAAYNPARQSVLRDPSLSRPKNRH